MHKICFKWKQWLIASALFGGLLQLPLAQADSTTNNNFSCANSSDLIACINAQDSSSASTDDNTEATATDDNNTANTNTENPSTSFACANAPDVAACMAGNNQTTSTAPTSFSVNTSSWLNTDSPVSVTIKDDADLGLIFGLDYSHAFIDNAIALKLDGGGNELRGNITFAHAFNSQNQFKLTYEYLAQNLNFDFESGAVQQWVGQNALGADYRYLLSNNSWLHAFDVTGSFIKADSKNLDTVVFNNDTQEDERRIAGGQEENLGGKFTFLPFSSTSLALGGGYSHLAYDTEYEDNQATTTPAYSAELDQLLGSSTKFSASTDKDASSMDNKVSFSQLWPHHLETSISAEYDIGSGDLSDQRSIMFGISYPAPKTYDLAPTNSLDDLASWVKSPAVYETQVLAIKDEKVVNIGLAGQTISASTDIGSNTTNISTNQMFKYNGTYDQVKFTLINVIDNTTHDSITSTYGDSLQLGFAPVAGSNTEYHLYAIGAMPTTALNTDDSDRSYTFTIQAVGYVNNKAVTSPALSNTTLTVTKGSYLLPTWQNTTLPNATNGQVYTTINLNDYIKKDPNNPQETFNYKVADGATLPTWLTLDGQTGQLSGTPTSPVNTTSSSATLNIIATSNSSGLQSATNSTLTINIDALQWAQKDLTIVNSASSNGGFEIANGQTSLIPDFQTFAKEFIANYNANDVYEFTLQTNSGAGQNGWVTQSAPGALLILDTEKLPASLTQQPTEVSLIAKDTTTLATTPVGQFTITIDTNNSINYTWVSGAYLPDALSGQAYRDSSGQYINMNKYVQCSDPNYTGQDSLSFSNIAAVPDSLSIWLKVNPDNGDLDGTPSNANIGNNSNITVKFHSDLNGKDMSVDNGPSLLVDGYNGSPPTLPVTIDSIQYYRTVVTGLPAGVYAATVTDTGNAVMPGAPSIGAAGYYYSNCDVGADTSGTCTMNPAPSNKVTVDASGTLYLWATPNSFSNGNNTAYLSIKLQPQSS